MIKFYSPRWVRVAFSKVKEFRNFNLVIANDRTKEEREEYSQLRDRVFKLRKLNMNARIKNKNIIINEKLYDLISVDQLLLEHQPREEDMSTEHLRSTTKRSYTLNKLGSPDLRKRKVLSSDLL